MILYQSFLLIRLKLNKTISTLIIVGVLVSVMMASTVIVSLVEEVGISNRISEEGFYPDHLKQLIAQKQSSRQSS